MDFHREEGSYYHLHFLSIHSSLHYIWYNVKVPDLLDDSPECQSHEPAAEARLMGVSAHGSGGTFHESGVVAEAY